MTSTRKLVMAGDVQDVVSVNERNGAGMRSGEQVMQPTCPTAPTWLYGDGGEAAWRSFLKLSHEGPRLE